MVAILLKFGADIDVKNAFDKTPMDIAKKNKDYVIIYLLKNFQKSFGQVTVSEGETKPALGLSLNMSDDSYPSDTPDIGTVLLSPHSKYNINSISSSP
eukprot:CAMPEP_0114685550 /NCGR_PEP_ID=MMETSP0191-20121206/60591_1 /TAXON_ID=126664 /ORGANISM="Sorites sp." /LENGTH=97 /DNA_ID=CAMNT_0001970147 /DNA_START=430 /DNA_END=719 /DNA_ORIENTATION=+